MTPRRCGPSWKEPSSTTWCTRWARPTSRSATGRAAEIVAREAERAGVTQLIYLGGLGDDAPGLSPHLRSRIETGRRLASGRVPVTVLRAAMTLALAEYAPTSLGLQDSVRSLGEVGPRLGVAAVYLYLVQVVLLCGYVVSLALARIAAPTDRRPGQLAGALG